MKIISIKDFPVGFFAMTMALFGLVLSWRLSGLSTVMDRILEVTSISAFIIVATVYIIKFLKHRESVKNEFNNPIIMNFFGTISVSMALFGSVVSPSLPSLAFVLWSIGVFMHFALVIYVLGQWLFHRKMNIEQVTPACFIPVVGLVIVPIYGAELGFMELSWLFWGIGLSLWIILQGFVFYRLMFVSQLPPHLMPTLFILLAPPSVIFVDYIHLTGAGIDVFSNVMYSFAVIIAVILLSQIKQFRVPFAMSYWAFTFPVIAFSMATMILGKTIASDMVLNMGYAILSCITLFVAIILVVTVNKIVLHSEGLHK